jgi:uncharacterized membrane protein
VSSITTTSSGSSSATSLRLEGAEPTAGIRAVLELWAAGEIDDDEFDAVRRRVIADAKADTDK